MTYTGPLTLADLRPAHRQVYELLQRDCDRWLKARDMADELVVSLNCLYRVLSDLDRLGVVDVRLIGSGFQEWRLRASEFGPHPRSHISRRRTGPNRAGVAA